MRRYEGLFILNKADDAAKDVIDKISSEIAAVGGKIETVQKMDKRPFARAASKKHTSGYYVNVIFEAKPEAITPLRGRFTLNEDVLRILFTQSPEPKPEAAKPAA